MARINNVDVGVLERVIEEIKADPSKAKKTQVIEPQHLPLTIHKADKITPGRRRRKRKLEPKAVADALRQSQGNRLKAAKLLDVSRATLHRFLAEETSQSQDS